MTEPSKTPRTDALCAELWAEDVSKEGVPSLSAVSKAIALCKEFEGSLSEGSSKWIPVGERLPDEVRAIDTGGVTFLACNDRGFVFCTSSHPSWWNHKDQRGPEFNGPTVTHWMPLPEAPK